MDMNTENLIELHENLHTFAAHYEKKGRQEAAQLIKQKFIKARGIRDGSPDGLLRDEGFDSAIKQVIDLLQH